MEKLFVTNKSPLKTEQKKKIQVWSVENFCVNITLKQV